ncbi:unnamed protein product, partial [Polarella glacialis]
MRQLYPAALWFVGVLFAAWPLSADSAECQCTRFRCRSDLGEFVYAVEQMLAVEAQWCVRNNSAYNAQGDCKYCSTNCKEDICDCGRSTSCDWASWAAGGLCMVVGILLIGIA